MAQDLPLIPSVANYRFNTSLDGVAYIIDVRFNDRESAWYMNLLAEDETPIRQGMKLVLGTLIGGRSASASFPQGSFAMLDQSGEKADADFDDLGVRVLLQFIPFTDLDELAEEETVERGVIIPQSLIS